MFKSLKKKLGSSSSRNPKQQKGALDDSAKSSHSAVGKGDGDDAGSDADSEIITVDKPEDFDILFGRGKQSFNHVGNRRFRVFIGMHLRQYIDAPTRTEKTMVVNNVCEAILEAGGRFLKFDARTKVYHVVNKKTARSKVGHALRDAVGTRVKLATASTGGGSNSSSGDRRQEFLGNFSLGSAGARSADSFATQQHAPLPTLEPPQRPTLILPRTAEARYKTSCSGMMLGSSVPRRDEELVSALAKRNALNLAVQGQVESHQQHLVQSLGLAPSNPIRHPIPIAPRIPPSNASPSVLSKIPPSGESLSQALANRTGSSSTASVGRTGSAARLIQRVVGSKGKSSSISGKERGGESLSVTDGRSADSVCSVSFSYLKDNDSIDSRVLDELDDAMSISHGSSSGQSILTSGNSTLSSKKRTNGSQVVRLSGLMGVSNNSLRTRIEHDDPHNKLHNSNQSVGSGDSGSQKKSTKSVMSIASARDESVDLSEEFSVLSVDNKSAASTYDSRSARGPAAPRPVAVAESSSCNDNDGKTEASPMSHKTEASPLSASSGPASLVRQRRNAQADQDIMDLFRDDVVSSLTFGKAGTTQNVLDESGGSSDSKFEGSAAGEISLTGL